MFDDRSKRSDEVKTDSFADQQDDLEIHTDIIQLHNSRDHRDRETSEDRTSIDTRRIDQSTNSSVDENRCGSNPVEMIAFLRWTNDNHCDTFVESSP